MDGTPMYKYNFLGLERYTIAAADALPAGKTTVRFAFKYDGGDPGSGGSGQILLNGRTVAERRIEHTRAMNFSADEGADVGIDQGTPVTGDYTENVSTFTGRIHRVTVELR
jgi:hypothetical protein